MTMKFHDSQHNNENCDPENTDTQYDDTWQLCWVSLCWMSQRHTVKFISIMLSVDTGIVIMLSVIAQARKQINALAYFAKVKSFT